MAVFDIEADRAKIALIHAAVHGELQRLTLVSQVGGKRCKSPVRVRSSSLAGSKLQTM
jgi:hypothetical protein